MWAKVESGSVTEIYTRPKSLTIGDVQHPKNIFELWSESELNAVGIYSVVIDNTKLKDIKYYSNTAITYTFASGTVTGSYGTATAKDLSTIKAQDKIQINEKANNLLQKHDWMSIREAEGGTAMPSNIKTWRGNVRGKANDMCNLIDGVTDVDALAALYVYNDQDPATRPLGEFPAEPS